MVYKKFRAELFLLDHDAESLFLEGFRVEDLVSAAGGGGQGDQQVRFAQFEQLTDRVGSGSRYDDVGEREKIRKLLLDVFVLYISCSTRERFVKISVSAEVDDLKRFQQLG